MSNLGSEWQGLGMRGSQQSQQFHDEAMKAGAEHLRVGYAAAPRRSHDARLTIAVATVISIAVIAVAIAL